VDLTKGQFTTVKLQCLIDARHHDRVDTRASLADLLSASGYPISVSGISAWFRHVDSNYGIERRSLHKDFRSYAIPTGRWRSLMSVFGLSEIELAMGDDEFQTWAFSRSLAPEKPPEPDCESHIRPTVVVSDRLEAANSCFTNADLEYASAGASLALHDALLSGNPSVVAEALNLRTKVLFVQGRFPELIGLVDRVEALKNPASNESQNEGVLACILSARCLMGDVAPADEVYRAVRPLLASSTTPQVLVGLLGASLHFLSVTGRKVDSLELFEELERHIHCPDLSVGRGGFPLIRALEAYRCLARGQFAGPGLEMDIGGCVDFHRPSTSMLGIYAVTLSCIDVEVALALGENSLLRRARAVLDRYYRLGVRFSLGWPFCVPHVIGRASARIGAYVEAHHYLKSSFDVCYRNQLHSEIDDIELTRAEMLADIDSTQVNPNRCR
jgi:hypothetical protein